MKISKNSWHYRFNTHVQGANFGYRMKNNVITTCDYVRTTLFSIVAEFVILFGVAALIFAGLCLTLAAVLGPLSLLFGFFLPVDVIAVGLTLWASIGVMLIMILIAGGLEFGKHKYKEFQGKRQSILRQTLQDRRDGICTIVEFD